MTRRLDALNEKIAKPLNDGKSQFAGEIRAHVAKSESPAMAAAKLKSDPRAAYAILSAPGYLSGLTAEQQEVLRREFNASTEAGREHAEVSRALDVCAGAVRSAEAMVMDRSRIRADGSDAIA